MLFKIDFRVFRCRRIDKAGSATIKSAGFQIRPPRGPKEKIEMPADKKSNPFKILLVLTAASLAGVLALPSQSEAKLHFFLSASTERSTKWSLSIGTVVSIGLTYIF